MPQCKLKTAAILSLLVSAFLGMSIPNITSAAALTPVNGVCSNAADNGNTGQTNQINVWYGQGIYWCFFSIGNAGSSQTLEYVTSLDGGATWSSATAISTSMGTSFYTMSTWYDSGSNTFCYVLAIVSGTAFFYRCGSLSSAGTISWSGSEGTKTPTFTFIHFITNFVASGGVHYVAFGAFNNSASNYMLEVMQFSGGGWSDVFTWASVSMVSYPTATIRQSATTGHLLLTWNDAGTNFYATESGSYGTVVATSNSDYAGNLGQDAVIGNTLYQIAETTTNAYSLSWTPGSSWTARVLIAAGLHTIGGPATDGSALNIEEMGTSNNLVGFTSSNLAVSWTGPNTLYHDGTGNCASKISVNAIENGAFYGTFLCGTVLRFFASDTILPPSVVVTVTRTVACNFYQEQCWWEPTIFYGMYVGLWIVIAASINVRARSLTFVLGAATSYASLYLIQLGELPYPFAIIAFAAALVYALRLDGVF